MKVLVVEDETSAYENLKVILQELSPKIEIVANTESVAKTVSWLKANPLPDLIFMDIHLSDDSAFSIFDRMEVETPIVFTTAYDQYAIEAFKVNSIDYLLKPLKVAAVQHALEKFEKLNRNELAGYLERLSLLAPSPRYKDMLLVPLKDKLKPVRLNEVSFFYTSDKTTSIHLSEGCNLPYCKNLEQIMVMLEPSEFFRANKQFIIRRSSVTDITIWFDNRLLVAMDVEVPERIYISKNRAADFKEWMMRE